MIGGYCDNPGAGYCMLWVLYQWRRWNVDGRLVDVNNEHKNFGEFVNPLLAQLEQNSHLNDETDWAVVSRKFNRIQPNSSKQAYAELTSTEYLCNIAFLSILSLKRQDLPTDIYVYQPADRVFDDKEKKPIN